MKGVPSVLVTGGAGYLGQLVVPALARYGVEHVVTLDVREPPAMEVGQHVTADIRTADLTGLLIDHDIKAVVHLAAIVEPPRGMTEQTLHDIEVGGTRRLLEACTAAGVRHVTVTSSGAAYGYHLANRGRLLTEDDPIRGSDTFVYARHKAEVERLLARHRRIHPRLHQLVLRPGTILGPATSNLITALFEQPVVLGIAGTEVPFVFVWDHDVAEIVALGVANGITGTYNVAGDGVLTLRDIARIEGKRLIPVPPGALVRALTFLRWAGIGRYGPEQVDFLRHRPVLANDRLKAAFPGLPEKHSRAAYEVYRLGRRARAARAAADG